MHSHGLRNRPPIWWELGFVISFRSPQKLGALLPWVRGFSQGVNPSAVTKPDVALMGVIHRNPALSPGRVQRKQRCDQRRGTRSPAPAQPGGRAGLAELCKPHPTSGFCKGVTKRGEMCFGEVGYYFWWGFGFVCLLLLQYQDIRGKAWIFLTQFHTVVGALLRSKAHFYISSDRNCYISITQKEAQSQTAKYQNK